MTCERCLKDSAEGEHGVFVCPLEPRKLAATILGDECDVTSRHGLCNADGSPRRYTSKSEMKREAEKRGMTNVVEHVGQRGSDKSPHTTKWY
jgi:hypothetical protein